MKEQQPITNEYDVYIKVYELACRYITGIDWKEKTKKEAQEAFDYVTKKKGAIE